MDRPKSIYAGHKLSEQTVPESSRTDQRLFGPSRPQPAPPPRPIPAADPVSAPEPPMAAPAPLRPPPPARPPATPVAAPPERPTTASQATPPIATSPRFDLADLPYRKASFLFTDQEFEALDDLKLSLRRELDAKVTKEDLVRCAVAYLVTEFRRTGATSDIFTPLRKRRTR